MTIDVRVPEMGESIVEATVGKWRKKEGDRISAGEALVELETEKTNLEVSAERGGTLERIVRPEGVTVTVSEVIATIKEESEAPAAEQAEAPPRPEALPGTEGPPGQEPAAQEQPRQREQLAEGRMTPLARNLAQEHAVDLGQVRGSGPGGRVVKEDVEAFLQTRQQDLQPSRKPGRPEPSEAESPAAQAPEQEPSPFAAPLDEDRAGRYEERVRLSRRRQTIARRLAEVQRTAAPVTTYNEVDMSQVRELRRRHRKGFRERYGVDLGLMPFFIKATIAALKAFPELNSELQGDELVLKHYYNIGIAVASDDGLVVPVLQRADRLSFAEIEKGIQGMVERTRTRKLSLEELRDGTFTVTNGGVFGSLFSTPMLNPPEVGILGMHRMEERAVVVDGQVAVKPMMYLALTYDHRVVDGHRAVQFLGRVKDFIEEPATLLFDG